MSDRIISSGTVERVIPKGRPLSDDLMRKYSIPDDARVKGFDRYVIKRDMGGYAVIPLCDVASILRRAVQ